jgi:hypothetical protein
MGNFFVEQFTVTHSAIAVNTKQEKRDLSQVSQTHLIKVDVFWLVPKQLETFKGTLLIL